MTFKILLIEDEDDFRLGLLELFELEGFDAIGLSSIADYQKWKVSGVTDALIIDRNLPDGDGLTILRDFRISNNTPAIILTGAGSTEDRIEGINADADFYLIKPIVSRELIAIIQKIARQKTSRQEDSGVWEIDLIKWLLFSPKNIAIALTKRELQLLSCFINKPGEIVNRNDVIEALGEKPQIYDLRRMEILVRRLRKKIEDSGVPDFPLGTVYGKGYAFNSLLKAR